jgi:uncharacterized repeat protein (TIGR02543 family)
MEECMKFTKLFIFICAACFLFFASSCKPQEKTDIITHIEINPSTYEDIYDVDLFLISDLSIIIFYQSGKTETVTVTASMMSLDDQEKLHMIGAHQIKISYQGHAIDLLLNLKYNPLKEKLYDIYLLSQSILTYEEWLNTIKGNDGKSIVDAIIDNYGHLILVLSDESRINAGMVKGSDGLNVEFRVENGHIEWRYENMDWHSLLSLSLLTGIEGNGIERLYLDEHGVLIVEYTNGSTTSLGAIIGRQGESGVGIVNIHLNDDGDLLITLSNTEVINLGTIKGKDGKTIQLGVFDHHISWKYSDEDTWVSIIPLSLLIGPKGESGVDGKQVQFQVADYYIQWRYQEDESWQNLIHIPLLYGEKGDAGTDGREVVMKVASGFIQWQYFGDETWIDLIELNSLIGPKGESGVDGKQVQFQVADNKLQWRYENDYDWNTLINLSSLVGEAGENGKEIVLRINETHIQWQYHGGDNWFDLIEISQITGAKGSDGKSVQLGVYDGFICWSYEGESLWEPIIEIESLVGPTGLQGVSILEMSINDLGELIITYDNDTTQNLGQILKLHTVVFKDYNHYILDVQMVPHGMEASPPSNPERLGHTFIGWNRSIDAITSSVVVEAIYTINTYTVSFDSNGGTPYTPLIQIPYDSFIELPTPERHGYTFKGWYIGPDIHASIFYQTSHITSDLTLYARWDINTYAVSFYHESTLLSKQNVMHGYSAIEPRHPQKEGFVFVGWSHSYLSVESDLEIQALFEEAEYRVVYYHMNGIVYKTHHVKHGDYVKSDIFKSDTHVFIGWEIAAPLIDGLGFAGWIQSGMYFNDELPIMENLFLNPKWVPFEEMFNYRVEAGEIIIEGYYGFATYLYIPDTYLGMPVVEIGEGVFKNDTHLRNVTLGSNVQRISNQAFMESNVETLYISSSVITIGETAFNHMSSLKKVIFEENSSLIELKGTLFFGSVNIETITLPDGILEIEAGLLSQMSKIKEITIPKSVLTLGDESFKNTTSLTLVTFESGSALLEIGLYAFANAVALERIDGLPNTITKIHAGAFYNNHLLVDFPFEHLTLLEHIGDYAFYQASSLDYLFVNPSILSIGAYAFFGTELLESVVFESISSLETIGDYAFADAVSLGSFFVPKSVISIGMYAFSGCVSMTTFSFAEDIELEMLLDGLLSGASSIETIMVPASVLYIMSNVFSNMASLNLVTFAENSMLNGLYGVVFSDSPELKTIHLPKSLKALVASPFSYSHLEEIYIHSTILVSTNWAFYNTYYLKRVIFDEDTSIYSIGPFSFFYSSVEEVVLPNRLTLIENYAFVECHHLTSIIFHEASELQIIDSPGFILSSLEYIYLPPSLYGFDSTSFRAPLKAYDFSEDNPWFSSIDGVVYSKDLSYLVTYPQSKENIRYEVPLSVHGILFSAFQGTKFLEELFIHKGVNYIESFAFMNSHIKTIEFEDGIQLETIQNGTFSYMKHLEQLIIPRSVTCIEMSAFESVENIETIVIPNSVLSIGNGAFRSSHFRYIIFEEGSLIDAFSNGIFYGMPYLESLVIPESVTTIETHAFSQLTSLTHLIIPSTVTIIQNWAFFHSDFTLYIEDTEKPEAWLENWNVNELPVIWGYLVQRMIYFNPMGGEEIDPLTGSFGDSFILPIPIREGYIFDGWYYDSEYQTLYEETSFSSFEITLYARWIDNGLIYTIYPENTMFSINFWGSPLIYDLYFQGGVINETFIAIEGYQGIQTIVTIPKSIQGIPVLVIGEGAFEYNTFITEILFESGSLLKFILDFAFYSMDLLSSLEIPASVGHLGHFLISDSMNLEYVSFAEGTQIEYITMVAFAFSGLRSFDVPASVKHILEAAFKDTDYLEQVTFASGSKLISIEASAFEKAISLNSIIIPASLEQIGRSAFFYTYSLETVIFEQGTQITSINIDAFAGTGSLKNIEIPKSVKTIEYNAFLGSSLSNLTFEEGSQLELIESNAFQRVFDLEYLYIPESVITIQSNAFNYTPKLKHVYIGHPIPFLGDKVFNNERYGSYENYIPQLSIYIGFFESQKPFGWSSIWNQNESNSHTVYWTYTLTFVSMGGSEIIPLIQIANTSITLPIPTRENYIFDGWYKESDFYTLFSDTIMPNENMALYAKWINVS